jgi:SAM-dependent methyltransferase
MRWQRKCLIDTCKGIVPCRDQLRALKYRLISYTPDASKDAWTIEQGLRQVALIRSVLSLESASVLEIGSGWQPMIPALFSLAGASRVHLTDLNRLCVPGSFHAAICSLRSHKRLIVDRLAISEKSFDEALAWDPSSGLEEGFRRLRLRYLAPCDCRRLPLPPESVDAVTSRAVLEHIPPPTVDSIFVESFRLLKPGGAACHMIDNSDHWQHHDKAISRINFLKFSDLTFRWTYLNSLNYQNRLRHTEYIRMIQTAGFAVLRDEREIDPEAMELLRGFPLAERFRSFATDDLATVASSVLVQKSA